MERITFNASVSSKVGHIGDKTYTVVPMVMITEGVHNGSEGPLYYPAEELSKTPQAWNHKPVVVYHPSSDFSSACDPVVLTKQGIGMIMNTRFEDGKLKSEAWLDTERIDKIDSRVSLSIKKGQMLELSTGLFTDNENMEGVWNGEKYLAIARNYRPDHLAILPDKKGACSIEDGAGFMRLNEDKREELIRNKIKESVNSASVLKVYNDYFIYEEKENIIKKQKYSVSEDNKIVFNGSSMIMEHKPEEKIKERIRQMDKEKMVKDLISNDSSGWKEEDKEMLMNTDEKILEKLLNPPVSNEKKEEDKEEKEEDEKKNENEEKTENQQNPIPVFKNADEFIASAPAEIQEILNEGRQAALAERNRLIKTITSNKRNSFSADELKKKPLSDLRHIAKLAEDVVKPRFDGQADPPLENEEKETGLPVPTMNFKKK